MQKYAAAEGDAATLVLPAVAFANVGELATDLLICTLGAQRVAQLDSDNLLACVGNNAYEQKPPGLLATALELHHVPGSQLYLLQQRAPAIPGRQAAFATEVAAWAAASGFKHALLLCGLDAQFRKEQQLEGSQLRYLLPSSSSSDSAAPAAAGASQGGVVIEASAQQKQQQEQQLEEACKAAGVLKLEEDVIQNEQELHGLLPPWPTLKALQGNRVPTTLLAAFAAEGDNAADAMRLAHAALAVLRQQQGLPAAAGPEQQQLRVPCSWAGLQGRRAIDSTLF